MLFTIYRMEHSINGLGPFRNDKYDKISTNRHSCHKKYPTKSDEFFQNKHGAHKKGFVYAGDEYYMACFSREWINYWFNTSERAELYRKGYVIKKYKVKHVLIGYSGTQCFFRKEDVVEIA